MSTVDSRPELKISDILAKLASGMSRKEIAKELGVSFASAQKTIFSHPKLKNRKTLAKADFILIDDAPDAPITVSAVVAEEVATPTVIEEVVEEVVTEVVAASNEGYRE